MPEMKLLDAPENRGGMTSGNAVAHETLEAYASAEGMDFDTAHAYASQYFGSFEFVQSRATVGSKDFGYFAGEMDYNAVRPDHTRVPTKATVEYPKGFVPGLAQHPPQRITKVEVIR